MKVTAQFALWSSAVFALVCLYVGFDGLSQIDSMADELARVDARGFAYFWLFLGGVAVVCALASWWIIMREAADSDR